MTTLSKISIITPSYNQAQYLESTIKSVLDQNYPNLEYIIIDGGSTDGSVDIIRKYADRLAYWVSEPDQGQAHAINKGIQRATGEWIAWQNSDDIYYPDTFAVVADTAKRHPEIDLIIGDMNLIDAESRVLREMVYVQPTYKSLLAEGMVLSNQAAFWKRSVHAEIGYLNEVYDCSFDYEWFLRLLQNGYRAKHVCRIFGALRLHNETKTSNLSDVFRSEYKQILAGRVLPVWMKCWYQMRRVLLTLLDGQYSYVFRGLSRRILEYKSHNRET